jgi:VCBS repeat-containing protein
LNATDVDSPATFVPQADVAGSNGYGKFSIDATGAWTYTMDTAHDEFVGGQDYTDSITVATADGTTQVITVTMTGTNDGTASGPTALNFNLTVLQGNGNGLPGAGTVLGAFSAVDSDGGSFVFSETSDASNAFTVAAATGQVTLNSGLVASTTYTLGVQVADELGRTANQTLVVQVGGNGDETLNGNASVNLQYGQGGADVLFGGAGNDILQGGNGSNQLHGGAGADVLYGNSNDDTFFFDTALGSGGVNETNERDFIYRFEANGDDTIWLSKSVFNALATSGSSGGTALVAADFATVAGTGASASVGSARIVYDSTTGGLYYDSDGGSAVNRILFATIDTATDGTFDVADVKVGL